MKEIRQIVAAYEAIDLTKQKAALATVARVEGSSYRRTGARMLVLDNGTYLGGISGGCLEGDALRRAQKAIASNQPSVVTYDTTREDHAQIGVGLGCNGIIDVLFTPLDPAAPVNPITLLRERAHTRTPRLLATITGGPVEALGHALPYDSGEQWRRDFPVVGFAETVLPDALECLQDGTSQTRTYGAQTSGDLRVCLEVLVPATHLVLYGSNNDVYPLARMARELGWDLTVVANPLKLDKSLFGLANRVLPPNGDEKPVIDAYTAVVLMAHDYKTDLRNFRTLLEAPPRYLGLLGPRKRFDKMLAALHADGVFPDEATLAQHVYAPAGLDIGALSPEEIALSIVAEITACFARRPGTPLRLREGSIH